MVSASMESPLVPSDLTHRMKIRSVLRRTLPALFAALAAPAALHAQPITYTFSGTTSFFGGSHAYVLTLLGDASDVADLSGGFLAPSSTYLLNAALDGSLSIDGGAAQSLSTLGSGYAFGVGALNGAPLFSGTPSIGVGFIGRDLGTGSFFGLFLPTAATYDLASNTGPVSGSGFALGGTFEMANGAQLTATHTSPFTITTVKQLGATTFSAQVTATPEPASVALLATGLVAIGGVAVRRRKRA